LVTVLQASIVIARSAIQAPSVIASNPVPAAIKNQTSRSGGDPPESVPEQNNAKKRMQIHFLPSFRSTNNRPYHTTVQHAAGRAGHDPILTEAPRSVKHKTAVDNSRPA
jgi:hypothetical protein